MGLSVREYLPFAAAGLLGTVVYGLVRIFGFDSSAVLALAPMFTGVATLLVFRHLESERCRAKESGAASSTISKQYQLALSTAGVGALVWDLKSGALHCTDEVYDILGIDPRRTTLSLESLKATIHPDDRDAFNMAVARVETGSRRSPLDCRFVKPEGGVVWVEFTMRLVVGEQGEQSIAGAISDVTERKQVEAQLDRGVAYLEAILENTKDIILSCDSQYRLTVFNSRFQANIRASYAKRVHVGDNVMELFPAKVAAVWKSRLEQALAGESFRVEEVFQIKGNRFYFDVSLMPIRDDGRVTGATVYSRNITNQKIREKEWLEAKERAEESDRLKSAFLANMSHEIRTPLNAVMGFAQLLKSGGGTEEERKKFLDIILSNGNHLLKILGDIIELAQIESDQLRVEPTMFDLRMLIAETYSAFYDRIRMDAGDEIELVIDNMDQEPDYIVSDETRLRQIIYNLLSNSIKFTTHGSIHVGYRRLRNDFVEFYVADTGSGIPAELRSRIFKRFRQGNRLDGRRNDGVGLGLSICQGLVSLLGGDIWVEDNIPNGSKFRFTVRDQSDGRPHLAVGDASALGKSAPSAPCKIMAGSKILVAEDDDMNFCVIDEFLQNEKLVPLRAKNGEEAIRAVEENTDLKLVVMDISMPVLNGLDATKRIKQIRPHLHVIAHTAHAMQKDLDQAMEAGCTECLVKPINIERFRLLLSRYM